MKIVELDNAGWTDVDYVKYCFDQNSFVVLKSYFPTDKIKLWVKYLTGVKNFSVPNYQVIEKGCTNFCRLNDADPRSFVSGKFWQMNFFPWNQDLLSIYAEFQGLISLRNHITGLPSEFSVSQPYDSGVVTRIGFQFYPTGGGMLSRHIDPVNEFQRCIPLVIMSEFGIDFRSGGLRIQTGQQALHVDSMCSVGDIVLLDPLVPHWVDPIDPKARADSWFNSKGRWMGFCPVNKFASNNSVENSEPV